MLGQAESGLLWSPSAPAAESDAAIASNSPEPQASNQWRGAQGGGPHALAMVRWQATEAFFKLPDVVLVVYCRLVSFCVLV